MAFARGNQPGKGQVPIDHGFRLFSSKWADRESVTVFPDGWYTVRADPFAGCVSGFILSLDIYIIASGKCKSAAQRFRNLRQVTVILQKG